MKRTKKIRPVSIKRSKMLAAYRDAKTKFLEENQGRALVCWCCNAPIRENDIWDFHHPYGRRTLETILRFQPVHRECHNRIHENPTWAREKGFIFF